MTPLPLAGGAGGGHGRTMREPIRRLTNRAQHLRNNATDAERHLWRHLSRRQLGGFKFSRQIPVGPFICDFLCRERGLAIELDGGQQAERTRQDARRTAYLNTEGVTVLRFWNNEVLANTNGVLELILTELERLPSQFAHAHPQPLPQAVGERS
jgi:very-short-patch-repair endonuclease